MRKLLLPVVTAIFGIGGGVGAGFLLRPAPCDPSAGTACGPADAAPANPAEGGHSGTPTADDKTEFVKLNNQFVIPVVTTERLESLVVMSLSIAAAPGNSEIIYRREPKLRDSFLQVLFDHANMGSFRGGFTDTARLDVLRSALREAAQTVIGPAVSDVLITDIARQDV